MGLHTNMLALVIFYHILFHERVQCRSNVFTKEDFDIDRQLKLLNEPIVTTIENKFGDIYDCVDFYKQPAFDHPLLKNHNSDFEVNLSKIYDKTSANPSLVKNSSEKESKVAICPVGSVPMRRITTHDLITERYILEGRQRNNMNSPRTYRAIVRTKASKDEYTGVGCYISLHNPRVYGQQFVAARIKLQRGSESIEAGWRVDPSLYGDNRTRFYLRTDAGGSHCFNTQCPGFIHSNREFPLDSYFSEMSHVGGPSVDVAYRIIRDTGSGNWDLRFGKDNLFIGFWPAGIFNEMAHAADYVEWGGEAYSSPGSPLPPMGSGNFPVESSAFDAYIAKMTLVNNEGKSIVAKHIEPFADDSSLYSVLMYDKFTSEMGRLFFYGGTRKSENYGMRRYV